MAAPTYSHYNNPNYKAFRKEYIKRHSVIPNEFAKVGFEFMWFIGHNLHKHGVYFQEELREVAYEPGFLFRGYDFQNGHSNQYVPFIYFREGQLHFLNNTPGY